MNMLRRAPEWLLALSLIVALPQADGAQAEACANSDSRFRIGVLYQSTDARKRVLSGVRAALADRQPRHTPVCIDNAPYTRSSEGLERLRDMIRKEQVDLVIGPTESDIFVQALRESPALAPFQVPVISPLVTARAGNDPDGWFFRTNVGVTRRSHVIFDFLRKNWIRSIGVLYANTEFGRRAEGAFQKEVAREFGNTDTYIAERYEPTTVPRDELSELINTRPEAIGIFGEREDIQVIAAELKQMVLGKARYEPILFTVLDASRLRSMTDTLYFVSVTNPKFMPTPTNPDGRYDDVMALSYDTTSFVLDVLDTLAPPANYPSRKAYRESFRNQFAAIMDGGSAKVGPKTGMSFREYSNESPRRIYRLADGKVERIDLLLERGWVTSLEHKIQLLHARFGYYPLLSLLTLLAVVVVNSVWDLVRWYEGQWWRVLTFWRTYVLVAIQFALGAVLFLILAESGKVQYDSLAVAAVIGFAPSQFLRLKFFETRSGLNVGIVAFYDWILRRLNEGLMVTKYKDLETKIQIIAHYNSEQGMRSELQSIFRHHRNSTQTQRLNDELQKELENEPLSWERRMVCARELLRRLEWSELQSRRLLPPHLEGDGNLDDPISWVRESRHYLLQTEGGLDHLDQVINVELEHRSQRVKDYFKRKVDEVDTEEDRVFSKVRFLVLNLEFDKDKLRDRQLLPPEGGTAQARPPTATQAGAVPG